MKYASITQRDGTQRAIKLKKSARKLNLSSVNKAYAKALDPRHVLKFLSRSQKERLFLRASLEMNHFSREIYKR